MGLRVALKDHLSALLQDCPPGRRRHLVREYLQARLLSILQQQGAMGPLARLLG
ncbi:MAG: hypothetical protein KC910_10170 [Candidatus Eremiobacteraeota bacterium]|nr:hypothetical protein [Candidatus Eremiobacteraeota bacterium]